MTERRLMTQFCGVLCFLVSVWSAHAEPRCPWDLCYGPIAGIVVTEGPLEEVESHRSKCSDIFVHDLEGNGKRLLWSEEGLVDSIQLSPDNRHLSFCVYTSSAVPPAVRVISLQGTGAKLIPNATGAVWGPDSHSLAVIMLEPSEPERVRKGIGLCTLDAHETVVAEVFQGQVRVMHWASFDGNLYFATGKGIMQYDPRTKATVATPYQGLHFSPGGRYYFRCVPTETPPNRLFLREKDEETGLASSFLRSTPCPYGWAWLDDGLLTLHGTGETFIFDCTTGEARHCEGVVLGLAGGEREVAVYGPDGTLRRLPVTRLERVEVPRRIPKS